MFKRDKTIEMRVGLFVLVGFLVTSATVVYFGRLGQGLQKFYDLQVDFPNASGLLDGSDVLLGGARIGYVSGLPEVLPNMQGVAVKMKVHDNVKLPAGSRFIIGSSGLLGNRFVDVLVDPKTDLSVLLEPGSTVKGQRETGIEDLTRESSEMLADARQAVKTVNTTLERLNETALSKEALEDLRTAMANIRAASADFSTVGSKSEAVFSDMAKASKDIQSAAADARKVMTSVRSGSGPLPLLLNDKQAAADLRAIIGNMRRHGVLWYKDSYREGAAR